MTQEQRFNLQVPFHTEVDGDGVTMNVCQFDVAYYAKIRLQMNDEQSAGVVNVTRLPYVIAMSTPNAPDSWFVTAQMHMHTSKPGHPGIVQFKIDGPGKYRLYIREPLVRFTTGDEFLIPQHALPNGANSGRSVQPIVELDVADDGDCGLTVQVVHPNELGRMRGAGRDHIPADGGRRALTRLHTSSGLSEPLDLNSYIISFQLWADASCAYGINHPLIVGSRFRAGLELIYGESLAIGPGRGVDAHDRIFRTTTMEIEFDHQSTTGGRGRLSFLEDNGHHGNRMTPDESLRRTHPATTEFLLQMLEVLGISYARITGAWRPHFGSTRHRYATALDITHVRTSVVDANNQQQRVDVHFHRTESASSNPLITTRPETAARIRMREFSYRVHTYLAQAKQDGVMGWLGGPWTPTYAQLGLAGMRIGNGLPNPNVAAFSTDNVHIHHIHISRGIDQE
ncbi:MAG: hypothetical protein ACN6RK_04720 [Stenotrophomonas sp.]